MRFTWDPAKEAMNRRKHGVGFAEAESLLVSRTECLELFDERPSLDEERFITSGPVRKGLLLVVWTASDEDVTRIISARWATPTERSLFRRAMQARRSWR